MTDPQVALLRAEGDFTDSSDERCKNCSRFYNTVLKKEMLDPKLDDHQQGLDDED